MFFSYFLWLLTTSASSPAVHSLELFPHTSHSKQIWKIIGFCYHLWSHLSLYLIWTLGSCNPSPCRLILESSCLPPKAWKKGYNTVRVFPSVLTKTVLHENSTLTLSPFFFLSFFFGRSSCSHSPPETENKNTYLFLAWVFESFRLLKLQTLVKQFCLATMTECSSSDMRSQHVRDIKGHQGQKSHDLDEPPNLPTTLQCPLSVVTLTGQTVTVTHKTERICFVISGNHHEWCEFYIFSVPTAHMILGCRCRSIRNSCNEGGHTGRGSGCPPPEHF